MQGTIIRKLALVGLVVVSVFLAYSDLQAQSVSVEIDLTPWLARVSHVGCSPIVGYRFKSYPGHIFEYAHRPYDIETDGATELIAARKHKHVKVDGKELELSGDIDQFGFVDVPLPEQPLPKVIPRMRHYKGEDSPKWTMVDGYPVWDKHQSWKSYVFVYALLSATTVMDIESTFNGLDRCPSCKEGNPIMRPFIKRGRVATYAFAFSLNAIQMEVARRQKRRHERLWVVAPLIGTGIHGAAATSNNKK